MNKGLGSVLAGVLMSATAMSSFGFEQGDRLARAGAGFAEGAIK